MRLTVSILRWPPKAVSAYTRPMEQPRLLTIPEVAATLHLSISATKSLVYSGKIRTLTIGRSRRCTQEALTEFIANCCIVNDGALPTEATAARSVNRRTRRARSALP